MNWKNIMLGVSVGIAAGVWTASQLKSTSSLTAEQALRAAKEALQEKGTIDGSWIHMTTETLKKNGLTYTVYRGGISRLLDDSLKQEEFFVDAHTGTIVDVV